MIPRGPVMLALLALGSCTAGEADKPDVALTATDGSIPTDTVTPPSTTDTALPPRDTAVAPLLTWVQVDMGVDWACGVVSDGTTRCWGADYCTSHAPADTELFQQVSLGLWDMCGIREDGTLECACCGDPAWEEDDDVCRKVPPGQFKRVEVGSDYACAQDAAGALTCWGWSGFSGYGSPPVGTVGDFAIEEVLAAAVLPDGTLQVWGLGNNWGEPPPADVAFAQVEIGNDHACGLDTGGTAWCWGRATSGKPYPDPPAGTWAQLDVYQNHSCVIDEAGAATCWDGEDYAVESWTVPIPAIGFAQIGLGELDGCGVDLDGQAWCWGRGPDHPSVPGPTPWLDVPKLNP